MVTATFRFHDELNDFLAPKRRRQAFSVPCAQAATTKHMIEALGVPHTEVARILVNGEPAGLDRLMQDGDQVAVYPRVAAMDAPPPAEAPLRRPGFVADAHLGGLARLLRMLGFDTLYDNHFHDDDIVSICAHDGRIVLTRDRELLKRRAVSRGCYVHALKSEAHLLEVVARFDLARSVRPFTLCLHCNAPLRAADKAAVIDRLPPKVREIHDRFSTCDICGHVYWEGSHWRSMRRQLDALLPAGAGT